MNKELERLVKDYLTKVSEISEKMVEGLKLDSKDQLLNYKTQCQMGEFELHGLNKFFFHGIGCKFENSEIEIDWDFGSGASRCSIDPWKFYCYINRNNINSNFTIVEIKKEFEDAVKQGMMKKEFDHYYLNE